MSGTGRRLGPAAMIRCAALAGALMLAPHPAGAVEGEPPLPPAVDVGLASGPSRRAAALSGNPLWAMPLAGLSLTRERPIFSPSRRPPAQPEPEEGTPAAPEPEPAPAEPEAGARPSLELLGTISRAEDGFAIFLDTASRATLRLRIGEEHGGWSLQSVAPRDVTLSNGGQTVTLALPARSEPPGAAHGAEPE
ncbi:hypothetical protein V5F53_14290 [Xanthobacter sp. V4C-4]|uniref:hypothetical protein n=1 Tax=Xanthobacter cornucopiae TaxID=3119924 RepID=UPI00372AD5F0